MKLPLILLCLTLLPASGEDNFYGFRHKGPDPDRLLFVDANSGSELPRATQALGIPPYKTLAQFVVTGPFGGCSAVYLEGMLPSFFKNSPEHPEGEKFQLVFASCPATEKQGHGPVKSSSIEVPIEFAIAMQRLWAQFILDACYRKNGEYTLDGDTSYFVVRAGGDGLDYRSAYLRDAPAGGATKRFADFANSLQDLKAVDPAARKEMLNQLIVQMKNLSGQAPALNTGEWDKEQ